MFLQVSELKMVDGEPTFVDTVGLEITSCSIEGMIPLRKDTVLKPIVITCEEDFEKHFGGSEVNTQ